jgi:hypothetical protein
MLAVLQKTYQVLLIHLSMSIKIYNLRQALH